MLKCWFNVKRVKTGSLNSRIASNRKHSFAGRLALAVAASALVCVSAKAAPMPSRWMSADGSPRGAHAVPSCLEPFAIEALRAAPAGQGRAAADKGRIAIVVARDIYDGISARLARHVSNLEAAGYSAIVYTVAGGAPEQLRSWLTARYGEKESLVGATLIGDIPHIVFEMMQDFDDGQGEHYEDFPCDIFFMDMDGAWSDVLEYDGVHAGNGKYDTWTGNRDIEIWVSRMKADNLPMLGGQADLLNTYLDKNDNFRNGRLIRTRSALVYDDDDWSSEGAPDATHLDLAFTGGVTRIDQPEDTTAADFKANRMPAQFDILFTRSHGSPASHGYYQDDRTVFNFVLQSDYAIIKPPAFFYSLFVCSGSDFTVSNNLAALAAFNPASGLLAWGSTKTGGMLYEGPFYASLAAGKSFGRAFIKWFNGLSHNPWAPMWFYGMALIGDASLDLGRTAPPLVNDYDGDDCSDPAVFFGGSGEWYAYSLSSSQAVVSGRAWGWSSAVPAPGDYDGDNYADLAVFDQGAGNWYAWSEKKQQAILWAQPWGWPGAEIVNGDYDGDRTSDLALYDRIAGCWYICSPAGQDGGWQSASGNPQSGFRGGNPGRVIAWAVPWGWNGAVTVPGDYDADGKADLAVYDGGSGRWYAWSLHRGLIAWAVPWGWNGATTVPGDYDGDKASDLAVFDSNMKSWFIWSLRNSAIICWDFCLDWQGSTAVPGDFDGDLASDCAVYDPAAGSWHIYSLANDRKITWPTTWGGSGAIAPGGRP